MAGVVAVLEDACAGRGGVALLEDPARTPLPAVLAQARELGMRPIVARSDSADPSRPLGLFLDALAPLADIPGDGRPDVLVGPSLLPSRSLRLFALKNALLSLLEAAAAERPVALVVRHWKSSDKASLAFIDEFSLFARYRRLVLLAV
jgi:hypothetical protein